MIVVEVEEDQELIHGFNAACGYAELGMYEDSWMELEKLGLKWQQRPEVLQLRGILLTYWEKWDDLSKLATTACQLYPNVLDFFSMAASAYEKLNQTEKARAVWLSVPASVKDSGIFHYNVARFEAKLGNFLSAREHLQAAIEKEPKFRKCAMKDPGLKQMLSKLN